MTYRPEFSLSFCWLTWVMALMKAETSLLDKGSVQAVCFQAAFEVYICLRWSAEVFNPNSFTLMQSYLWLAHVAFEDLVRNRNHSDVNSGVALKGSTGKHQ